MRVVLPEQKLSYRSIMGHSALNDGADHDENSGVGCVGALAIGMAARVSAGVNDSEVIIYHLSGEHLTIGRRQKIPTSQTFTDCHPTPIRRASFRVHAMSTPKASF